MSVRGLCVPWNHESCTFIIIHAGFVSNGEFNYLRTTQPLSVLDIRSSVRKLYSRLGLRKLASMLMPYSMTTKIV